MSQGNRGSSPRLTSAGLASAADDRGFVWRSNPDPSS